jgi:asparagine synthase (glutamine-hydrolysing)
MIGRAEAARLVEDMTASLAHRGPDGGGLFSNGHVALGHQRLAILDLSPAGAQPMTSRDGRWTIALNGEIFNYRELQGELGGLPFRSSTDTEVLLEACAAWGVERVLERSIGMFALALWDHRDRELTLARDRVGEKPLVYFWDGQTLAFASELKALGRLHSGSLDAEAVEAYLALGYVPAPLAIFRHTRKLAAGHWLRWKDGALTVRRWWFPEQASPPLGRTPFERQEELRALVADAVRLRLRADVPVALALSGGIDSSVIAAEAKRQGATPDAFTVVFDGQDTDLPYARRMARELDLRHEVFRASASPLDQSEYDEPFADSSAVAALALARALGGRYKVVLNGDGGDEAFGGYRHYEYIGVKRLLKRAASAAGLTDGRGSEGVYVSSKTTFREGERSSLLNGHAAAGALPRLLSADEFLRASPRGILKQALWSDRHLYLANNLAYKMDIALGACGIEGRAPLLDHRILEFAQGLPDGELVRGREKKILLRDAYRGQLPAEVVDRPKHGFGAPIEAWLSGPLRGLARELLPCPLLDSARQRNLGGQRLWTLLVFAAWARQWSATW